MGNCIDVQCHEPAEKSKVLMYNGEEREFKALTRVKKITAGCYHGYKIIHHAFPFSPLSPNSKLEPGELYYLVPSFVKPLNPKISSKLGNHATCTRQKVKIVLTTQQLELLLRNAKEFKSKGIAVRSCVSFREGDRKWQPSLSTIQEVPKF